MPVVRTLSNPSVRDHILDISGGAAKNYDPARITRYVIDLAGSFLFSCWSYWRLKNNRSWLKTFFFKKYSPDD